MLSAKADRSILERIPIVREWNGYFKLKDGSSLDILELRCKDLERVSDDELELDIMYFSKLYKTCPADLKIVSLNFPTDTIPQQRYFRRKLESTKNHVFRSHLGQCLQEAEWIQKHRTKREYYLFVFSEDEERHNDYISLITKSLGTNTLAYEMPLEKKKQVLYKLNNKCSAVFNGSARFDSTPENYRPLLERKKTSLDGLIQKNGYDPILLASIQSQGGVSFKDEKIIKTGDGFESCVYVYQYAKNIHYCWLSHLLNIDNAVVTLDIGTENILEVKRNINKSMQEQESRYSSAQKETERKDAQTRYTELLTLYEQLTSMGEVVKLIHTRIFIAERTQAALEDRTAACLSYLESNGYKGTVSLNESKYEWDSLYLSYTRQNKLPNHRYGQPVVSETLAAGDPFNGADLSDPLGAYYGTTRSGGSVFLDLAFNDGKKRFSYNGIIAGTTGSGKSTFLKKAIQDRVSRGDFVRGFDVTGEFTSLVKTLGGKIISLDGSGGILNPLEIMKTDESDTLSWTRHISKMSILFRFWAPESDMYDVMAYESLLSELYLQQGIQIPQDGVPEFNVHCTGLASGQYPVLSDLLSLIDNKLSAVPARQTAVQKELMLDDLRRLRNVRAVIQSIVKNYGNVFDGHTSIENLLDTQLVFFNIRHLAAMKPEIFQAQLYSVLSLCWDNALRVGIPMKSLYESQSIEWEEITRFFIVIDEAHRIVNAGNLTAVQQLTIMAREDRKFFTGILMATQSILDCVPENSEKEGVEAVKTLFSLMQYKYMFQQASDSLFRLKDIFGNQLTESEYEQIPRLERGECIQVISGGQNYHYHVEISEEQRLLFQGGA